MKTPTPIDHELESIILRQKLAEAQDLIHAIRSGSVDAFIADNGQVYTLQSADHVYRVFVDTMNQGAVTLGLDGIILYANRKFSELMGADPGSLVGRPFIGLVCDVDQADFMEFIRPEMKVRSMELTLSTCAGSDLCAQLSLGTLVPYDIPAVSMLITDLTERKRNEETAVIRKRLELSQSAGRVGTFDWNIRTGSVHWTKDQEELFGLEPGSFEGTYNEWARLVHDEDRPRVERQVADALVRGTPFHVEYRIVRPDRSLRWIEAKGTVGRDSKGEPVRFVGVNIDITERKQLELRLERSNAELADYAAVVSHDLQEPLRTISSYLSVIENEISDDLDDKMRRYFTTITNSTAQMGRLIRGILEYSQAGGGDAKFEPVDSNETLNEALANLDELIRKRDARISADPLPVVRAIRVDLIRLFQNLIGNALKFCVERPCITISTQRGNGEWRYAIADNGPGIEPRFTEQIFKLFQRLTRESQVPGNGIGLATCKKVADRHGGRIWVESIVGNGSTFIFTIPD